MDTILPSQPSTYRQLIKRSFALYRASFTKIIWLSIFLAIVAFVPRLLSDVIGQDIFLNLSPRSPYRLWLVLVDIIGLIFFIGILWHMYCVIRGLHEPLAEDIYVGIKKVFYVIIAAIIQSAAVFAVTMIIYGIELLLNSHHLLFNASPLGTFLTYLVFIAQLILIFYIYTLFIFLTPLIAIENKGILSALQRSALLVWDHWWRVFSVQYTPWICYAILLLLIRFVFRIDIHIYFIEQGHHTIGSTILHIAIFALYIPWVAALLIVQLKDLELRKHILATNLQ